MSMLGSQSTGLGSVPTAAGGHGDDGGGGSGFPGFGGAPPAVASSSVAGTAGTASRSDHTHALDLVPYAPSVLAMRATGVLQQTFAAGAATPSVRALTAGQVVYGGADSLIAQSSAFYFDETNVRWGFGTSSPDPSIQATLRRTLNSGVGWFVTNSNAGTSAVAGYVAQANTSDTYQAGNYLAVSILGRNFVPDPSEPYFLAKTAIFHGVADNGVLFSTVGPLAGGSPGFLWTTHNIALDVAQLHMQLSYAGNLSLPTSLSDAGGGGVDHLVYAIRANGQLAKVTLGSGLAFSGGTLSATGGGGGAPSNATFITQTPDATLTNEQALSLLGTGIMSSATTTGVVATTTMSAGSIPFGAASILSQDNANFFWDNTNKRMGVKTTTPAFPIEVVSGGISAVETTGSGIYSDYRRGIISIQISSDQASAHFSGAKARGTPGALTAVLNGDYVTGLIAQPYDGAGYLIPSVAAFKVADAGTISVGSVPTDFVVNTSNTTPDGIESLRVRWDGLVAITRGGGNSTGNLSVGYAQGAALPTAFLQLGPNAGFGVTTGALVAPNLAGGSGAFDRAFQVAPVQTANATGNTVLAYVLPTIATGITQTTTYGVHVDSKQGTGTMTNYAGLLINFRNDHLGATNGTAILIGQATIPGNYTIYDASTDPWRVGSLAAGGMVKSTAGVLAIAAAGTDYQAAITWPAAKDILVSTGTTSNPTGEAAFTYDTATNLFRLDGFQGIGVDPGGLGDGKYVLAVYGNATQDRIYMRPGGITLAASGEFKQWELAPATTALSADPANTLLANAYFDAMSYTGGTGSATVALATTVYIAGPPSMPFFMEGALYTLYVAAGISHFATVEAADLSTSTTLGTAGALQVGGGANLINALGGSTQLGFFAVTPVGQQTGGSATAGGTYTATEQSMLQKAYSCLRSFGLLS